ncbi:zinc ribbon domain-containing protein [Patescibacteria group bacterium]|nr:zinc ribbon domain-containing protein [Patescibacteria group bacterium]
MYEGVHQPAVSRELWNKVQRVYKSRGRAQAKFKYEFPFLGLLRCAECGGAITAETHTKRYKNGNSQSWRYYRCTKKSGEMICHQPYIREAELTEELVSGIRQLAIPEDWADKMLEQVQRWEVEEAANEASQVVDLRLEVEKIAAKLRRLTDLHLDGELDRAEYSARKRQLVNEKIALEARLKLVSHEGPFAWLEPLRDLINAVRERSLPAAGGDLLKLRDFVAEVGSNLSLNSRKVLWDWNSPYALLAERGVCEGWQAIVVQYHPQRRKI